MSRFKNIAKEGWQPKARDGGKESWRGDFKGIGQVAGWMGKGKDTNTDRSEHTSQPISSLKDPSSFGPPPKHTKFYGASANERTPDRSGLGAPLAQEEVAYQDTRQQQRQADIEAREAEQEEEERRPPVPYRVNTTGLATDHLPPPPRRLESASSGSSSNSRPKPSLPPRLPPRTNSIPGSQPEPSPPPAYSPDPSDGYINQEATARLAKSGVSVPALGIGDDGSQGRRDSDQPVNELQNRFSQMRTNSYSRPAPPPPPSRSSTANDSPSASSPGGIRSTVSDFRERHSDKIDAGKQRISGINEKYGMTRPAPPPPSASNARDDPSPSASGSGGIRSTVSDFRERHSDKIDAGKQKASGLNEKYISKTAPPPPQSRGSPDAHNEQSSGAGGIKSTVSDFRERHSDKIDAGKQKVSGLNEKYISKTAPPPPPSSTSDTHNNQSSGSGGIKSTVSDLRERHGDKIDTGKQKISGINEKYEISQRARGFVDNQRSAPSSQAPPRPQASSSPSTSSPVDVESVSRKKPPPPPPPKRAEIRAPAVNESSPTPPPLPLGTKPR